MSPERPLLPLALATAFLLSTGANTRAEFLFTTNVEIKNQDPNSENPIDPNTGLPDLTRVETREGHAFNANPIGRASIDFGDNLNVSLGFLSANPNPNGGSDSIMVDPNIGFQLVGPGGNPLGPLLSLDDFGPRLMGNIDSGGFLFGTEPLTTVQQAILPLDGGAAILTFSNLRFERSDFTFRVDVRAEAVPEPASCLLLGLGGLGALGLFGRRRVKV